MSTKNTSEHGVSETRSSEQSVESARASLRERCLSLVRRWQPLACSGWDHRAARELGDELEHIMQISDELALDSLNTSALELAAYLCLAPGDRAPGWAPGECRVRAPRRYRVGRRGSVGLGAGPLSR